MAQKGLLNFWGCITTCVKCNYFSKWHQCLLCMWKHFHFCFSQLGTAYVSATTGAVATALGLNSLAKVLLVFFSILTKLWCPVRSSQLISPLVYLCRAQLPLWSCNQSCNPFFRSQPCFFPMDMGLYISVKQPLLGSCRLYLIKCPFSSFFFTSQGI